MTSKLEAIVKSPSREHRFRIGKGFSLGEIKKSGHPVSLLKTMKIPIDYFRKSVYENNVELLKQLEIVDSKKEKREPFVRKEKKKTPFKAKKTPKKEKIAEETVELEAVISKKGKTKKPKKKEKAKKEKIIEEKVEKQITEEIEEGIALTELSGLGPATEKKFLELGVNNIQDLIEEVPKELATLVKGCSEDRIKNWIEEAKKILEE